MRIGTNSFQNTVCGLAAIVLIACPIQANATRLYSDTFDYPDGRLVQPGGANGGWFANSGSGIGPVNVSGGTISLKNNSTDLEDVCKPVLLQPPTATTFATFALKVPGGATLVNGPTGPGSPPYFASFRSGTADSLSAFRGRICLVTPGQGGDFRIGITAGAFNPMTHPVVAWPSDLTFGQSYRIVTAYNAAAGTATLWVDPVLESSPSVTSPAGAGTSGQQVGFYCFRQGTPMDGTNVTAVVDSFSIGTSFANTTGTPRALPSVTTWGLVVLGSIMALMGSIVGARRLALAS